MNKFRDGMIGPTVILFTICFVITIALAATYQVTLPVIEASEAAAADLARSEVLPAATTFTRIEGDLPEGIQEAYVADNGSGYVFKAGAKGFDGLVTFMVGVDADGNYVGINMFDHNETPGLGTKVAATDYLVQYKGQNSPDAVDAITGATRTSNALKETLSSVNVAYSELTGAPLAFDSITSATTMDDDTEMEGN